MGGGRAPKSSRSCGRWLHLRPGGCIAFSELLSATRRSSPRTRAMTSIYARRYTVVG
jgi:hypothetical protein